MTQDNSLTSWIRKVKLSPIGWLVVGVITALFWDTLLWMALIAVIGYLGIKLFNLDGRSQK